MEEYYEVIPKDDDPEVAIVLDRITDSAKRRIDYKTLEETMVPYIDPDFFVYETLCHLNNNETSEVIATRSFSEIMMQGFMLDKDYILEVVNSIKDNCQIEMYVLQLAGSMIFADGADPMMVLASLEGMLI